MALSPTLTITTSSISTRSAISKGRCPSKIPQLPSCHRLLASLGADETNYKGLRALLRTGAAVSAVGFKDPDPDLRLLWGKFARLRLTDEAIGDLCSAAIQFSDAHYMQASHAFLVKGGEVSEHTKLKKELSIAENQPRSQTLFKRIKIAEADQHRWTDRQVKSRMRRLSTLALELESVLTEVVSSDRLFARAAPILDDPLLEGIRRRLRRLQDVGSALESVVGYKGPSAEKRYTQSALHIYLRKEALKKMVWTMPNPQRPNWTLLSELIHEASGKTYYISSSDLRKEYASYAETSPRKRGLVARNTALFPLARK